MLGLACFFLESLTLSGSPSPFLSFYGGCHCPGWCAYDVVAPLYWHAALFVLRSLPTFVLSLGLFLKDSRAPLTFNRKSKRAKDLAGGHC